MGLRDKAVREREDDYQHRARIARERDEALRAMHESRAEVTAEWLSRWADEEVTADQLQPVGTNVVEYKIALDGFDLLVEVLGDPEYESLKVEVWQYSTNGMLDREVKRPADLLDGWDE